MMYGVLLPDPNLGRYNYNTVHFPRQCLGGAILLTSFCLQDRLIISTGNLYQKRESKLPEVIMPDVSTIIFEELKKELVSLTIKPGEKINESDVCDRFSVTRPSVRAAFQRLQDVGLLEVVPYKGATATLIRLSSVHQMIHLHTAVESWIIRDFIASNPSPFVLEELEHNLRMQKLHIQAENVDEQEFYRLDSAMHQYWFEKMRCGEIWNTVQKDINYERFRMLDFVGTQGYQNIVRDHEKLLEMIREGDAERVVPILSSHLNAGLARMGNLILEDYRSYFVLDETDNEYWVAYNQKLIQSIEETAQ